MKRALSMAHPRGRLVVLRTQPALSLIGQARRSKIWTALTSGGKPGGQVAGGGWNPTKNDTLVPRSFKQGWKISPWIFSRQALVKHQYLLDTALLYHLCWLVSEIVFQGQICNLVKRGKFWKSSNKKLRSWWGKFHVKMLKLNCNI